jgi:CHASE3 domain sensor protein
VLKKETENDEYKGLREFIESYDEGLYQSPEELEEYVSKLWKDHEKLEAQMEVQQKFNNWEIRVMQHELESKIRWIQEKCAFYIESLELALNETKVTKDREINRLNHIIAEVEGRQMREIIDDEEIERILKMDHTLEVCVITEAHKLMTKLKN